MKYGEKIIKLRDSLGIKRWTDYGEKIGLSGNWLSDQAKKDSIQTVDKPRLIKLVEYHQISLDYLLRDDNKEFSINKNDNLSYNDILVMINNIQEELKEKNVCFNGYNMNNECKGIVFDSLDILKEFIKTNL